MLGFGPLGELALGQLPSELNVALGATITLTVTLEPGRARGERQEPPIVIGGGGGYTVRLFPVVDAVAPGAVLDLYVLLIPGRARGTIVVAVPPAPAAINGTAPGDMVVLGVGIAIAGRADGFDGIAHDNEFLLLAAA